MQPLLSPSLRRLIALCWVTACCAHGAPVPVTNASFESPTAPASPGYQTVDPTGWTRTGNAGVQLYSAMLPFTGATDSQVAWLASGVSLNYASDLRTIAEGETYTLKVDAGSRSNYASSSCTVALTDAAGAVLATTGVVNLADDDVMHEQTVTFTATAGHASIGNGLRIRLNNGSGSNQTVFDNVRLDVSGISDPAISLPAAPVSAGTVEIPATGSLSVPVGNTGSANTLTIAAVNPVSGDTGKFALTTALPLDIAPGGSSSLAFIYTPGSTPGNHSAVFAVTSNDVGRPSVEITLTGTATVRYQLVARFHMGEDEAAGGVAVGGTAATLIDAVGDFDMAATGSPVLGDGAPAPSLETSTHHMGFPGGANYYGRSGSVLGASNASTNWIMEGWFKPAELSAGDAFFLSDGHGGGGAILYQNGARLGIGLGGNAFQTGAAIITPGRWYHVALVKDPTYNSGKATMLVNGIPYHSLAFGGAATPAAAMAGIAAQGNGAAPWKGEADEIIYATVSSFNPATDLHVTPPADADGDGLADAWEDQYFGDNNTSITWTDLVLTDGSGDADDDGFTDRQEHDAGTLPKDATSPPQPLDAAITSITKAGNTATIQFTGGSGKTYLLAKSLTLADGFPVTVGSVTLTGTTGTVSDPNATEPKAFYRLHLAPSASLSNLDLTYMTSGWGTPQVDKSIAGQPLVIAGESFAHGIGTHSNSEFTIGLDGRAIRFRAKVGLNDPGRTNPGSVVFQVYGDGELLFDSGVRRGGDPALPVDVPLTGVIRLRLVVTDAGDGLDSDHADWADAVIEYAGAAPAPMDPTVPFEPESLYPPAGVLIQSPGNTTYYVDPVAGNDQNDGLASNRAWSSIAKVNFHKLAAGDTVVIAPGIHRETLKPAAEGTAISPAVIRFLPGTHEFPSAVVLRRPLHVSNTSDNAFGLKPIAILTEGAKHLRIEGGGVAGANKTTLLLTGPERMVKVVNHRAENVTYSGLVFDLKRPCVSEMRVLTVETNAAEIQVAEGSTYQISGGRLTWTGDLGTGWVMAQIANLETRRAQRLDQWNPFATATATATDLGGGRVRLAYASGNFGLIAGRQYMFRHILHDSLSIFNDRSKNLVFENCEINAMTNMSTVSQFTDGITYRHVDVVPPANTFRTCPAVMDIFHFANCRGQVLIESCKLSGMGDDGVNYHGIHLGITAKPAANQLQLTFKQGQTFGFAPYAPGDEIAVINHNTLREYAGNPRRIVTACGPLPGDTTGKQWLVTLDGDAPTYAASDVVDNITWQADLTVRDCHIELASCRGILATTRGKIILENNTINSSMPGVLIEDDANFWWESSCVRDLTIRNNTFLDCGIEIAPQTIQPDGSVHENIVIENNVFSGYASANHNPYAGNAPFITAHHVKGLTITGNTFPREISISVSDCEQTTISGNIPSQ